MLTQYLHAAHAYTILTCCSCLHNTYMLLTILTCQRRLVTLLHEWHCANHAIHGRFKPVQLTESADHYLRTSKTIRTDIIRNVCSQQHDQPPLLICYDHTSHDTWHKTSHDMTHNTYILLTCVCDCTCVLVDRRLSDMSKCMQLLCVSDSIQWKINTCGIISRCKAHAWSIGRHVMQCHYTCSLAWWLIIKFLHFLLEVT